MKSLFLAVGLFLLAILLFSGKGLCFVAGYNTEIESHKKQWNRKALSRSMGLLFLILSVLQLAVYIVSVFYKNVLESFFTLSIRISVVLAAGMALYICLGKRFKNT